MRKGQEENAGEIQRKTANIANAKLKGFFISNAYKIYGMIAAQEYIVPLISVSTDGAASLSIR